MNSGKTSLTENFFLNKICMYENHRIHLLRNKSYINDGG